MILRINKKDGALSLLALLLYWPIIIGTCNCISRLPGLSFLFFGSFISYFFSFSFICLISILTIGKMENRFIYMALPTWLIIYILTYLPNPEIGIIATRGFIYFVLNIFCLAVLFASVNDIGKLLERLVKYIPLAAIYAIAQWLFGGLEESSYSMSFTYEIMIPMLLCLLLGISEQKKERISYITLFVIFLITVAKCGSRGGLLCCVLAILLYYCMLKGRKALGFSLIFIGLAMIVVANLNTMLRVLGNLLPNSRTVWLLTNGMLFYPAGRYEIYNSVLHEVLKNPFQIRGIYSDRLLLAKDLMDVDKVWGSYSHNVFLELLYQWGVWCVPIVIGFILAMIKAFFLAKRSGIKEIQTLTVIIFSFAIGQLMFSSSYLIAPSFGLLLGFLIWMKRHQFSLRKVSSLCNAEVFMM